MTTATSRPHDRASVELSLLIVRVVAGVIFAAHGSQKVFGAFDGAGLSKTVESLNVGPLGYLVAFGEFFGGLGLVIGLLTRFSAASLIIIMIGAIVMVHGQHGLFLQNQGFEYNLALIGLLAPTLLAGPGPYALGRLLPLPRSPHGGRVSVIFE